RVVTVLSITQSLRINKDTFTTESLFANLLDELKRLRFEDNNNNTILYISLNHKYPNSNQNNISKNRPYKGKRPYKVTKGKYCRNCKRTSHNTVDCFFLFPEKAPSSWNHINMKKHIENTQLENGHANDDNEVDVLYTRMDHEVVDLNMTDNYNEAATTRTMQARDTTPIVSSQTPPRRNILYVIKGSLQIIKAVIK
ncbi:hypothetical protein EPUL_005997, partial [Erysiphe pulchra]